MNLLLAGGERGDVTFLRKKKVLISMLSSLLATSHGGKKKETASKGRTFDLKYFLSLIETLQSDSPS